MDKAACEKIVQRSSTFTPSGGNHRRILLMCHCTKLVKKMNLAFSQHTFPSTYLLHNILFMSYSKSCYSREVIPKVLILFEL